MRAEEKFNFRVSPRVLAPLGMEQLQDPALAILELVKNAWDANATKVMIEVQRRGNRPRICVSDNGDGMSLADFRDRWLVIGASHKRGAIRGRNTRPLIGEKGLGRLASYALGSALTIESAQDDRIGFEASLDWDELLQSSSVESYKISVKRKAQRKGTKITIGDLNREWSNENTQFLTTHAQFLTSVPGERFTVSLKIDGRATRIHDPLETISAIAEGDICVAVEKDGLPRIVECTIDGTNLSDIQFRDFPSKSADKRLAGARLHLKFYRRDQAVKKLSGVLNSNSVNEVLERYQGIRVYRDGINVPPYGLNGDDWAALEKQRTSTGGPTMVPGNSQLIGELLVPASAGHLVITAGRSGFSDQASVKVLAAYVQWSVRQLGTARRAKMLGIFDGSSAVPSRVDSDRRPKPDEPTAALDAIKQVADEQAVRQAPELRSKLLVARKKVEQELLRTEETLRLYAQLASTGIAATSFAHEMRAEFDVVSEAVAEISESDEMPDRELISMLSSSWKRITSFVGLFKVIPVKVRRTRRTLSGVAVQAVLHAISELAPSDKTKTKIVPFTKRLYLVPAEFDSILLNLVSNAVKAIAESPNSARGKIRIALLDKGGDVEICVADNGCGISNRVAQIMFEPLEGKFSEGTGMGLPIVKFIAERYGGGVGLHRPPQGYATELRVLLRGVVK